MPNGVVTCTITPSAVNSLNSGWCIKNYTDWMASGESFTIAYGTYTIQYRYVEGYTTPADETLVVDAATEAVSGVYGAVSWPSAWNPPISMCLFRGQVIAGGCKLTAPGAAARRVRWSEIGAFRFLGATANPLRNEAGEYYLDSSDTEMVLRVLPTDDAVIIYGTFSVVAMIPVSQPAPTFSFKTLDSVGIMNPLAVAAGKDKHVFIDRNGFLCTLGTDTQYQTKTKYAVKQIGYEDIFSAMQASLSFATGAGIISVVYNKDLDEFYISNGVTSYVFDGASLAQLEKAYTSYVNLQGSPIATHDAAVFRSAPLSTVTSLTATTPLYIITETIDFETSSSKMISMVEVVGKFGTSAVVQVMVQYRNTRSGSFTSTSWKRCSPAGVVFPMVSGVDFRIAVQADVWDGTVIDNLKIEWQLNDKHSVRGNYTDARTASPNAGR